MYTKLALLHHSCLVLHELGPFAPSLDLLVIPYANLNSHTSNFIILETDNAIENVKRLGPSRMLKLVNPALPSDAALAIIKAGVAKKKRLHYPYAEARFIPILYCFFPDAVAKLFRYVWELKQ